MKTLRTIFLCLWILIIFEKSVRARTIVTDKTNESTIDLSPGITLRVENEEASIVLKLSSLLKQNQTERRDVGRLKFKNGGILQRIGMAMMMAPVILQLMWLPATLASIKMNLLRSLFVGKIALAVMLYNSLRNSQKSAVIIVHKPEHHEHYYDSYRLPEDDDEGWLGR